MLFFLVGSGIAPEINEAHYLAKAKHFWNPQWCPNDAFLNSVDAHSVFYITWGWTTQRLSLTESAWLGRLVAWILLAACWSRLSWSLLPRWGCALLSAGLWVAMVSRFHMSGEWIIGGIEAKVFAYAFVLWGLAEVVYGRWNRAWLLLGVASAFHVLVGGWTVVAVFIGWACQKQTERPTLMGMAPALLLGGFLSLPGLLPSLRLTWQADAATAEAACQIYVFDRLRHHLLVNDFPVLFRVRHAALVLLFLYLVWTLRHDRPYFRLAACVVGAVVIAALGILIQWTGPYSLVRLYWFRATDVMVPLGVAIGVLLWIQQLSIDRKRIASSLLALSIVLVTTHVASIAIADHVHPIPAADRQGQIVHRAQWEQWQEACRWIAEHTPADACVLAPMDHQTFKWNAGRSEVVTWKDIPQDAVGILDWQQRREDVTQLMMLADAGSRADFQRRLRELAQKYEFDYWLVRTNRPWPTQGLALQFRNESYAIYGVPRQGEGR